MGSLWHFLPMKYPPFVLIVFPYMSVIRVLFTVHQPSYLNPQLAWFPFPGTLKILFFPIFFTHLSLFPLYQVISFRPSWRMIVLEYKPSCTVDEFSQGFLVFRQVCFLSLPQINQVHGSGIWEQKVAFLVSFAYSISYCFPFPYHLRLPSYSSSYCFSSCFPRFSLIIPNS